MRTLLTKISLALAIMATPFAFASQAAANTQSGYGYYSEWIYTGGTPVAVSFEVFVSVNYTFVNANQIQILAGYSSLRGCLKNAASLYSQTGYVSSWTRGWYIYSDSSGDIDADGLNGSTSGFWPACSGSYDWAVYAVTSGNHWPPAGTRVKGRAAYCITRQIGGGTQAGCSGYEVTYSGYMW